MLEKGKLYQITKTTSEYMTYSYVAPDTILMFLDCEVVPRLSGFYNKSDTFFSKTTFEKHWTFHFKFKFLSDKKIVVATFKNALTMPEFEQYITADERNMSYHVNDLIKKEIWKNFSKMLPADFILFAKIDETYS